MKEKEKRQASIFELDGIPSLVQSLPLALQHVVAMIVGCVTPAIIVAGVAGLDSRNSVLLIQSSLVVSALSTLLQLFPIGRKWKIQLGSGLPVIMGVSFAYVASMQAIAADVGIAAIFGAQIVGAIVATLIGLVIDKVRRLFPPMVTGIVIFTIGISLYPTAINYMAGGTASENYGHWTNWVVAFITLGIVILLNTYGKGYIRLSGILIAIVIGYIIAACFGMVDLTPVKEASFFQPPRVMHFGIQFDPASCVALAVLFAINAIQAIGDFTATTTGSMDRIPEDREMKGAVVGYGCANLIGAFLGGLPTASYSQNVGIVTSTKVINRFVLGIAAAILLAAGLIPKFSALLTTIPVCVLGGATLSVFAGIAVTGIKLMVKEPLTIRSTEIIAISVAMGVGITQAQASLAMFPDWVLTVFAKTPVVISLIVAALLNLLLPEKIGADREAALKEKAAAMKAKLTEGTTED